MSLQESSQVSPQDILTLAKQGHPRVIAAIMNHSTKQRNIKTQVVRKEDCLYVLLEAEQVPDQQAMVNFVRDGIQKLKVEPIKTIKVFGRQIGDNSVAWNQEIQLEKNPSSFYSEASTVTQSIQPYSTPPSSDLSSDQVQAIAPQPPVTQEPTNGDIAPASTDTAIQETQNLLRRPEAVVLVLFVSVVLLWQLYLALVEEVAPEGYLSSYQLAQRLGVSASTVRRRKIRDDFSTWTQSLDPEGIAWAYSSGAYVPTL
ncbi:MAG: hypothetical protein HC840_20535 [Leptolyngbyaceae cyanobacterium RM2_2_4]|nr:hypothetical protein [Leptolyngbyaceae cyanobacterium SM1_4_3]NJN91274.1 hypothetical protein [Leptolyngbyaceae cyanobacterium SL_5_14]NJO51427.1 hypothetical protein [Leptolyngbyaceae cyanobacterium RM2_2_4]NJO66625.1 hypothetical protein [Leptolyngbyaceae cyanobacterium RM1_405_57]